MTSLDDLRRRAGLKENDELAALERDAMEKLMAAHAALVAWHKHGTRSFVNDKYALVLNRLLSEAEERNKALIRYFEAALKSHGPEAQG